MLSNYELKYQENNELLVQDINQPLTDFFQTQHSRLQYNWKELMLCYVPHVQGFNLNLNFLNKIWKLKWEKEQFGPFLLNHVWHVFKKKNKS